MFSGFSRPPMFDASQSVRHFQLVSVKGWSLFPKFQQKGMRKRKTRRGRITKDPHWSALKLFWKA